MKRIFVFTFLCVLFAINAVYALSVTPTSLSISSGETGVLQLSGGSGYYNVTSSDDTIASASFAGNIVDVLGISKGSAIITIQDGNDSVTIQVDVDASIGVSQSTVYILEGDKTTIDITNGVPPFSVNQTPVADAVINGSSLTITGVQKGTAKIIVTDKVSGSVQVDVIVYRPLESDKSELFLAENTSGTIVLSEGITPYTAVSVDDSIADVSVSGDTITINGKKKGTTYITFSDSAPNPDTIVISVNVDTFNVSVRNIYISKGGKGSFDILGTGFYNVSVSDDTILSAVIKGNSVVVNGMLDGLAIITINDSSGKSIDVKGIVYSDLSLSKSGIIMDEGDSETLQVSGGVAPYTIVSSTPGIVDVPGTWGVVPFDVKAIGKGNTILTITDIVGSSASATITVLPGKLGVSKQTIVVSPQEVTDVTVFGGSGFYMVSSSDPSVADVKLGTNKISIEGISPGKSVVTVQDNKMDSIDMDITVLLPAPKLNLVVNTKTVSMTWNSISGADSYILYYAPPDSTGKSPDLAKLDYINLGDITSFDIDLNTGDAYFVAVQAIDNNDPDLASQISNIEFFKIP